MLNATIKFKHGFEIVLGDAHSQAGTMVLKPGEREGGPDNRHRGADQWLFVVSGQGEAEIAGKKLELSAHTLVLIQRGDAHGFRNTGEEDLVTLTFYVPPAYDGDENELPAGRS